MNFGFPFSTPKTNQNQQIASTSQGQGKQKRKEKAAPDSGKKQKQRVFINRANTAGFGGIWGNNASSKSVPSTPQASKSTQQPSLISASSMNPNNYFGPQIPADVMENVLFRFLYNIPENEKSDQIRVCFHIELAHWFYLDFYCPSNAEPPVPNCKKVGFPQFARQVFYKCDYLEGWRKNVDSIIDRFRQYKSNVPTYGVIMLDPTLNYILLVQGYYASKNSWGFPKGKINEGELPVECAIREAFEEVGFDSKENISDKIRPLQCFIGETLVCLYLAIDVPMDFEFKPHLRKEIRKISWFSVWDLPKDRNDEQGCARLGLQPNNFYSVHPFIKDICTFIQRERAERNKPKCSVLKHEGKSENSAFQPVIPRASSNQTLSLMLTPASSTQNLQQSMGQNAAPENPSTSTNNKSTVENLFKPLKVEPDAALQSFTGQTFLEQFVKAAASPGGGGGGSQSAMGKDNKEQQIPKNPAGVIGGESRRRNKEIKQPKPLQLHASKLIVNVYEAPPETASQQQSSPESQQKAQQPKKTKKEAKTPQQLTEKRQNSLEGTSEGGGGGNEIVNMLRSSIGKKEQLVGTTGGQIVEGKGGKEKATTQQTFARPELVPTQVRLCEAWKKFTFDKSCFQKTAAAIVYPSY